MRWPAATAAGAATMSPRKTLRAPQPRRPRCRKRAWSRSGRLHCIDETGVDEGSEIGQPLDLLRLELPRQFDVRNRSLDCLLFLAELAGCHRNHGVLVLRREVGRPLMDA